MPKISIIIPTYEHGDTLEKCLLSLFSQTFKDYEIIVVNDGSTDNTAEILEKYKDKIKIISQENRGAQVARNNGFKESKCSLAFRDHVFSLKISEFFPFSHLFSTSAK